MEEDCKDVVVVVIVVDCFLVDEIEGETRCLLGLGDNVVCPLQDSCCCMLVGVEKA
jgi:hypothetical protein